MKLQCHCGNIRIETRSAPDTLTRCNCSTCNRYGALWGYYRPAEVTIDIGEAGSRAYRWGDGYLDFIHCQRCGCMTHSCNTDKAEEPRTAVNFRMIAPGDIADIRVRQFDGADSWRYLD